MPDLSTRSGASRTASPDAAKFTLGRVVLLVHDFDEALAFYRAAFDAVPIYDQTVGSQRFLHIGFDGAEADRAGTGMPAGIWFVEPSEGSEDLVGRQAGGQPFLVLYTRDLDSALARFTGAGGEVRKPLQESQGARFAHVEDLYGNEIVLVALESS
jgi:predicted enzyme related to lactoylglutathione lyase